MSKLIELLKRVTDGDVRRLGFGPASQHKKTPGITIVASVADAASAAKAIQDGAQALLIGSEKEDQLRELAKAAGENALGVRVKDGDGERLKSLSEAGCDFIVVESIASPWNLLKDSGLGKVLQIDAALSDTYLRAIGTAPANAFLVAGWDDPALTIQRQIFFRLIGMTRKPVMALAPAGFSPRDIEGLWDAGVTAIVTAELDRIAEFRDAVAALPARRKPREEKRLPLLPHLAIKAAKPAEVEEGEDEEEEDEEDQ